MLGRIQKRVLRVQGTGRFHRSRVRGTIGPLAESQTFSLTAGDLTDVAGVPNSSAASPRQTGGASIKRHDLVQADNQADNR
jgi:hypothetical protein